MNKNLEQAIIFHKQGRMEQAEQYYLSALADDFDHADTLCLLGTVYLQRGKVGLAANLFKQCLFLKKDSFDAWNNLGNAYLMVNKEVDARMCFERALTIPNRKTTDYSNIYNNLATLHINTGTPSLGIPLVSKALELEPNHQDAGWNMALLYLEQGLYDKGFDYYINGFKTKNRIYRDYGRDLPYWDGTPNQIVVVWGEQGIGDEIMFASMLSDLKKISKQVIFECHPRLFNIFKESFPDLTIYPTRKDDFIEWTHDHPDINAKIAIGDLGKYFRRNISSFPKHDGYLRASQERIEHYNNKLSKLGNSPKIGISWTGGYTKTRKDYRTAPLLEWESILKQDAEFISMQYTPDAYNTIAEVEDKLDVRIHHWPSCVNATDYMEIAALTSALDMIITVNTAQHHIAGALGKPCWTLTPKGKAWRYYSPELYQNVWYPSVKQYETKENGNWKDVLTQISDDLSYILSQSEELVEY